MMYHAMTCSWGRDCGHAAPNLGATTTCAFSALARQAGTVATQQQHFKKAVVGSFCTLFVLSAATCMSLFLHRVLVSPVAGIPACTAAGS